MESALWGLPAGVPPGQQQGLATHAHWCPHLRPLPTGQGFALRDCVSHNSISPSPRQGRHEPALPQEGSRVPASLLARAAGSPQLPVFTSQAWGLTVRLRCPFEPTPHRLVWRSRHSWCPSGPSQMVWSSPARLLQPSQGPGPMPPAEAGPPPLLSPPARSHLSNLRLSAV